MKCFRLILALVFLGLTFSDSPLAQSALTVADVQTIIAQTSTRALVLNSNSVVAVTDREGYVLGVWSVNGSVPSSSEFNDMVADAIAKACTAAFLSSDQHAFSSRTAGFIVQQHFSQGIRNKPPAPWWG